MKAALQAPEVIAAIQAQNVAHANLTEADIQALDRQWRAERKVYGGPLVEAAMSSPSSAFLRGFKAASGGVISEIFIMDNKGLNAGQTDPTGDYMQGDEDMWLKTFALGTLEGLHRRGRGRGWREDGAGQHDGGRQRQGERRPHRRD